MNAQPQPPQSRLLIRVLGRGVEFFKSWAKRIRQKKNGYPLTGQVMSLTREQFARNLVLGMVATRKQINHFCWNEIPERERYFVVLNASYDGNPLAPGEYVFPDHNKPQSEPRISRSAEEVVELLWRDGKIPEWIDITPYEVDGTFLYSELRCCGRFTDQDACLYHKQEGYPPFHIFGPVCPVGYHSLKQDGKFDLHCYRDR